MKPGQRIKFAEEKVSYKIIAANDRFLICTKPLNLHKTYLYTIVDLLDGVRGPDDRIFGPKYDYDKAEGALKGLRDLMIYELEISARRRVPLKIEWVK